MDEEALIKLPLFNNLPECERQFLITLATRHHFTFQQMRMLVEFCLDMHCWQQESLNQFYLPQQFADTNGKQVAERIFQQLKKGYDSIKNRKKSYATAAVFNSSENRFPDNRMIRSTLNGKIMGRCPVASEKTRCCNLMTLDAVQQCGFDCSYCSIQSFYHGGTVRFIEDLDTHLNAIKLDQNRYYHIGTGQSSDSLMWGNKYGLLDSLSRFAAHNPNVILEMKSKSGRIDFFLEKENRPPINMLFSWSLNSPVVIAHEEKGTAKLYRRLESARRLADIGCPIGFHFHPIVWYQGWQNDYRAIVHQLTNRFQPEEIVMISLGTITFIKAVLKRIRKRVLFSTILQMPMEDCAGKLSYPPAIKEELFSTVYQAFPEQWRNKVFFYLCMEDSSLWQPVLGRSYPDNETFEADMLKSYYDKIQAIKNRAAQQTSYR
ncbi:MAG: DNA photolyase [Desulfobacterales bacterium]|nr:MAG: DNA photolyase [Desulfobacterales bacterium]